MMICCYSSFGVTSRLFSRFTWVTMAAALIIVAGCSSAPKSSTSVNTQQPVVARQPIDSENLWDRVRSGFAIPDLDTDLVRSKEEFYARRPEYMTRMISRSEKYLYHIVEEIERRGMPTELALLPFVESAYRPGAVSSAKAAGMWQFIPSTGRHYSLKQNLFRDERRDVIASTNAALDYLQNLYNMFGDWQLALASYNWGEGNVQRAIKHNQAAGKSTRYQDLHMPRETREYIPKLQAIKNIVRNPAVFDTVLPHVENEPYFKKVAIDRDIDVDVAARLAGIRLQDFRDLNPASNKSLIIASVTPHILLPADSVETFQSNLSAMGNRQLASWTAWVPKTNVTLEEAAKQSGTDVATLRRINRIPRRGSIRAGSVLLVPRNGHNRADISRAIADTTYGVRTLAAKSSYNKPARLKRARVRIRRGDTLSSIAARYGLSPITVAKWNRMRLNQRLIAGKTLVLRVSNSRVKRASVRMARVKIRRGDTLSRIAARHGVSTKQLARWNNMRTNQRIVSGRTLVVRGGRGAVSSASKRRSTSSKKRVKIRRGDTLSRIAVRHGVSTKQLARWNNMRTNQKLVAGRTLVIAK